MPSSPATAHAVYQSRVDGNVYDMIFDKLKGLGPTQVLAMANYGLRDSDANFYCSLKAKNGAYAYEDADSKGEWSCLIFGEIAPASAGTQLSAAGNWYTGPKKNKVRRSDLFHTSHIVNPFSFSQLMIAPQ